MKRMLIIVIALALALIVVASCGTEEAATPTPIQTLTPSPILAPTPSPIGTTTITIRPPKPTTGNRISWVTGGVSLEADDFYMLIGGMTFYGNVDTLELHGYSYELDGELGGFWYENGVEMRLQFSFGSDGEHWWVRNIATYPGGHDWWDEYIHFHCAHVEYESMHDIDFDSAVLKARLGTALTADVDIIESGDKICFRNLRLQPWLD